MPKCVTERDITGAGKQSPQELQAIAQKPGGALKGMGPAIQSVIDPTTPEARRAAPWRSSSGSAEAVLCPARFLEGSVAAPRPAESSRRARPLLGACRTGLIGA